MVYNVLSSISSSSIEGGGGKGGSGSCSVVVEEVGTFLGESKQDLAGWSVDISDTERRSFRARQWSRETVRCGAFVSKSG